MAKKGMELKGPGEVREHEDITADPGNELNRDKKEARRGGGLRHETARKATEPLVGVAGGFVSDLNWEQSYWQLTNKGGRSRDGSGEGEPGKGTIFPQTRGVREGKQTHPFCVRRSYLGGGEGRV